jgi:hypothetical protein
MNLKVQLVSTLQEQLIGREANGILTQNVNKYLNKDDLEIPLYKKSPRFSMRSKTKYRFDPESLSFPKKSINWVKIAIISILIGITFSLFYLGGHYISTEFGLKLYLSILIEIGTLLAFSILIFLILLLTKNTYARFENKFESIKPKNIETKNEFNDDVYYIISNTYETLSFFRRERERQAKNSFNAALSLIIAGILIVFLGVFLLFKKNIAEGSLTSGVGAISNILGGTIIKFYAYR